MKAVSYHYFVQMRYLHEVFGGKSRQSSIVYRALFVTGIATLLCFASWAYADSGSDFNEYVKELEQMVRSGDVSKSGKKVAKDAKESIGGMFDSEILTSTFSGGNKGRPLTAREVRAVEAQKKDAEYAEEFRQAEEAAELERKKSNTSGPISETQYLLHLLANQTDDPNWKEDVEIAFARMSPAQKAKLMKVVHRLMREKYLPW